MKQAVAKSLRANAAADRARASGRAQPPRSSQAASGLVAAAIALALLACLAYGLMRRDDNWITPEHGLGYMFGLVGTIMMGVLLVYPLRKRFRFLRGLGRLPSWLNFHMLLGVVGPTLVILHSNFRFGATNSAVALATTLIVMTSGIVGRYIYGKTHNRLTGELRGLQDLRADMQAARDELQFDLTKVPALQSALDELEGRILHADHGLFSSLSLYLSFASSSGRHRRHLLRLVEQAITLPDPRQARRVLREVGKYLTVYLGGLTRAAGFRFYERMFALWHVFHVPLLFLLIAATAVHVIAVHLY